MGWIKKTALGTAGLIGLGAFGGYIWFWGAPVGVNNYINKASLRMVADSPEMLSYMGMIDNTLLDFHSDKLGSYTKEQDEISLEKLKEARAGMDKYGPDGLEGQELLSWKITAWFFDDLIAGEEFEYSGYPMSQLSGPMVDMPQFLTDTHVIKSKKSAERYVSRVAEFGRVIGEMEVRVREYADNGVIAPDFVLEKSITGMRSFVDGGASENPLVTTLPARLEKVDGLSDDFKSQTVAEVKALVESDIIPDYESMIALHEDLLKSATHDAGIWRIPNGEKIYQTALRSNTTTDMTADEIHNIGLSEVARIEKEMDAILQGEGLSDGPLSERVAAMMGRADQIYPDSDAGRAAMIAELERLNEEVMAKAGDYFVTLPPQPLEIKRIPEYSQDGAPGGYYSGPALDGSRPGQFYINLKDPVDNPKWTLPTLLYHEAAPGHHFQISRSQMIEDVPILRKMSPFTAYTEGWALYAEYLAANDMGMYDDNPLGDLGRLQAEMFRAVRLVVDTGLHHKRWTREEAIDYMAEKTGNSAGDVEREIERYAVWPGQATAYKTGQLAILRLRKHAEDELGEDFNLRNFNELILENGAMPLGILDEVVKAWVVDEKRK
jgi:uncharacterized protein (DUF885 family)